MSGFEEAYKRIVTDRDPSIMSEKAALGYFKSEVQFLIASRWLRKVERATGRSAIPNTLNDLRVRKDISAFRNAVS
jgi:hypothetical protein